MSRWSQADYKDLGFTDECATVMEVDYIQAIAKRRAEQQGVTVTWDPDVDTAMTNRLGEITIPSLKSPISKEDLIRTYMYVVHETGHLTRPDAFKIIEGAKDVTERQCILMNVVEDDGMERAVAERFLGDAKVLGQGAAIMAIDGKIFWEKSLAEHEGEPTEEQLMPMIVMAIQQLARRKWDSWSADAIDKWLRVMPPVAQPLTTALVKEGWVDKFLATKDPHDCWDLAMDIEDRLYPPEDKKEEEKRSTTRATGHKKIPQPVKAGEGGSDSSGGGKSEEDEEAQGFVVSWKDIVLSDHDEKDQGAGGPMGIDWKGFNDGKVALAPDEWNKVFDLTTPGYDLAKEIESGSGSMYYGRTVRAPLYFYSEEPTQRALANQIRKYVQSQARTKHNTEQEHGRIDKRAITRLFLPPIDGGNWNRKVFYNRAKKRAINTAVCILVDWSGSMNGDKMKFAADASMRATDVFGRSLRMPVMLASFTGRVTESDIGILKHFDAPASRKQMAARYSQWYLMMGGNDDADAVMWAYRRLAERKEPRKLLIVMSDGSPAESYPGGHAHHSLLAATRHIQDEGRVELFGLGIKSNAVSNYYDNFEVVQELDDINPCLLGVLKGSVHYE